VAVALVMPNKKLSEVTVERILNKFKEPSFAKGVNREIILKAEEMLGLKLEELAEIALKAMQEISDELGLYPDHKLFCRKLYELFEDYQNKELRESFGPAPNKKA
jgi:hypothetical protein